MDKSNAAVARAFKHGWGAWYYGLDSIAMTLRRNGRVYRIRIYRLCGTVSRW